MIKIWKTRQKFPNCSFPDLNRRTENAGSTWNQVILEAERYSYALGISWWKGSQHWRYKEQKNLEATDHFKMSRSKSSSWKRIQGYPWVLWPSFLHFGPLNLKINISLPEDFSCFHCSFTWQIYTVSLLCVQWYVMESVMVVPSGKQCGIFVEYKFQSKIPQGQVWAIPLINYENWGNLLSLFKPLSSFAKWGWCMTYLIGIFTE